MAVRPAFLTGSGGDAGGSYPWRPYGENFFINLFFFFLLFDPRSLKVKQQNRIKTHRLSPSARVLHRKKKNNNKNRVISSELISQWNDDKPGEGGTEVEVRRWGGGGHWEEEDSSPRPTLPVRPSVCPWLW